MTLAHVCGGPPLGIVFAFLLVSLLSSGLTLLGLRWLARSFWPERGADLPPLGPGA